MWQDWVITSVIDAPSSQSSFSIIFKSSCLVDSVGVAGASSVWTGSGACCVWGCTWVCTGSGTPYSLINSVFLNKSKLGYSTNLIISVVK